MVETFILPTRPDHSSMKNLNKIKTPNRDYANHGYYCRDPKVDATMNILLLKYVSAHL